VVGGGREGLKKVESLLTQNCKIIVLSEKINPKLAQYVQKKKITFKKIRLDSSDFLSKYKPFLVMAATSDKKLNRKIVEKAKKTGSFVYASDDPQVSDFSHPSIINIEDTVQVAVSTGGRSPVMARKLKLEAEKIFKKIIKKDEIYQIRLQQIARDAAKGKIKTQIERKKFLYAILDDVKIKQLIKDKEFTKAQKRAMAILSEWK